MSRSLLPKQAMELALTQAQSAVVHGDVPIGAVVLSANGELLSQTHNRREVDADPSAHAEILALRFAAKALGSSHLDGCTLVSTLEPCTMCAGALVQARISRLVLGAWDEKAGAVGSLWDVVRAPELNHRVEVVSGILEAECATLLRNFFDSLRTR